MLADDMMHEPLAANHEEGSSERRPSVPEFLLNFPASHARLETVFKKSTLKGRRKKTMRAFPKPPASYLSFQPPHSVQSCPPSQWYSPSAAGPTGHHATSDEFIPTQQEQLAQTATVRMFFLLWAFIFFNALVWECILVAKKLVSYCRLSESEDEATVKIACYFDSSHIITINDTVYLYIFTLTNGV